MILALPHRFRSVPVSHEWWQRLRLPGRQLLLVTGVVVLLYGIWPFATLWRLNHALLQGDWGTVVTLVDLPAVRGQLERRLDKEQESEIGEFSDRFILWLEQGLRRSGPDVLEDQVNLDWLCEQLLFRWPEGEGFFPSINHAWFTGPCVFSARVGEPSQTPLHLQLRFIGFGWRVVVLYY